MVDWRVYYDDGKTFDNDDGSPDEAPALGVVAIVQPDESVGRIVLSQYDYYWWSQDDEWYGGDLFGVWDYMARGGWKRVLFGRQVPNPTFSEIHQRAIEDNDFEPKSAWRDDENQPV